MTIELLEVAGVHVALKAMRNPLNSHAKSSEGKDFELSSKLVNAGTEHGKHLRMVQVWVDLNLPRYIWSEFDTYKYNTKVSESTMHTIHKRNLTEDDFMLPITQEQLTYINMLIDEMNNTKSKEEKNQIRRMIKANLPEGFLQKRTVNTNYAELLSIHKQRKNHKLPEWKEFCKWIETLPYFKEMTKYGESNENNKGK